ncbi:TPA: hypothetical protein ACN7HA_003511 [Klebsiella pneumoniae]
MTRFKLNLSSLAWFTFVFFIITKAFAGPIGMYFPYLRFIPILLMIILMTLKSYKLIISKASCLVIFSIILLYIFIGVLYSSLGQALFGLYMFVPLIFSFIHYEEILPRIITRKNHLNFFLFVTCIIGVLYVNSFGAAWIGMEQEIGGVTKQISKAWSSDGIIRNPGFTSGSVTAASIILITASMLSINLIKSGKYIINLCILSLSVYSIFLTTTKTMIFSICIVMILIVIPSFFCRLVVKLTLVFSVLFSYFFMFGDKFNGYYVSDNTFLIRMFGTWPNAISMLDEKMSLLFGKGFGAIGTPTYLFNANQVSPADNFYVYLYVIFGLISSIFIALLFLKMVTQKNYLTDSNKNFYILLFIIFLGALTYNLVESTIYAVYGGVLIGAIWFGKGKYIALKV